MNRPEAIPGWSRTRWIVVVAGITLVQFALAAWFGQRSLTSFPDGNPRPWVRLGDDDPAVRARIAEERSLRDPTLFALPHPMGFSASAWTEPSASPSSRTNWQALPEWLPLAADRLGEVFLELARTNTTPAGLLVGGWATRPGAVELVAPQSALATQSTFRISGALGRRPLAAAPVLPVAKSAEPLLPSVVELSVNAAGHVQSIVPVSESGLRIMDQRALLLARQFRFQPLASAGGPAAAGTWGRIAFHWATISPDSTNPVPTPVTP